MLSVRILHESPLGHFITKLIRKSVGNVVVSAEEDKTLENDPFRASYVLSIPQAQIFKGVLLQGYLVPPDILSGLEEMEIRPDDVFIITYPKSGTTWTEEIVSMIYSGGDESRVQNKLLIDRVLHLEVGRPLGHLRFLRGLKSPRLMATHLPYPIIPKQLREAKCKVIYVIRNPKDTAVSYYHHHKMSKFLGNYSGTWEEFLAHFMAGHVVYGSWFDHVLGYWQFCHEHPDKVFFISYEELKLDLKNMVQSMSKFLERPLSEKSLETICKHCSFEEMKTNQMVNREKLPIPDLFDMSKSKFMRKGIIGDWKNYFTKEQSQAFDMHYKSKMAQSTLHVPFEPEEAYERMCSFGRIIYNHPVPTVKDEICTEILKKSRVSKDEDIAEENCLTAWLYAKPAMQANITPDHLLFDFVY